MAENVSKVSQHCHLLSYAGPQSMFLANSMNAGI
jgi:hypothetical protein